MAPLLTVRNSVIRPVSGLSSLVLCLALALPSAAAGPGEGMALLDLQFAAGLDPGQVQASVRLLGGTRRSQVVLFHRPAAGQAFERLDMEAASPGLYVALLPEGRPVAGAMDCYVLAIQGDRFATLGTRDDPLTVPVVREGRPLPVLPLALAGSVIALGSLSALALERKRRRRRRCWEDDTFWDRMLGRFLDVPGPELSGAVTELSRKALVHPRLGAMRWGRAQLFEKLTEMRAREGEIFAALKRKRAPAGAANTAQATREAGTPSLPSAAAPRPPVPYRDPTMPGWVAEELHALLAHLAVQEEDAPRDEERRVSVVHRRPSTARPAAPRPERSAE